MRSNGLAREERDDLSDEPTLRSKSVEAYGIRCKVQAHFIGYLVNRLYAAYLNDLSERNADANDSDERFAACRPGSYLRSMLGCTIAQRVGEKFSGWFDDLDDTMTRSSFFRKYGQHEGPLLIFKEIFPDIPIEQFLIECLNEVGQVTDPEICERRNFVRGLLLYTPTKNNKNE